MADTTAPTDQVDTSINEDEQDTDAELELEHDDASFEDETDDQAEEEQSDDTDAFDESEAESQASDKPEDETEESESDAESTDQKQDKQDQVSKQEAARRAWKEREAARQQREAEKDKAYQEYVNQDNDLVQQSLRRLEVETLKNTVINNTNTLQNGLDKAVAHIPLFKNGPPAAKEELANALDDFERMYVVRDRFGEPVQVNGDVFQYLQTKAAAIQRIMGTGEQRGKRDSANTRARTLSPPTRKPKEAKSDPLMEGFDEEANSY
jgi:hypothetical protein